MGKLNRPKLCETIETPLCACGCLQQVSPGCIYVQGHNAKTKPKPIPNHHLCSCNTCDIMVASDKTFAKGHANKGKKLPPGSEAAKKMSDAKMGLRGEETNRYGTTTSEQGLENMRIAVRKRLEEGEVPAFLGHHHTEETKEVLRIKATNPSEETKEKSRFTRMLNQILYPKKPALVWLPMQLCACGCMKFPEPGNQYIHGHHARDREWTLEAREATRERTKEDWAHYTDEERNARVLSWAKSQHMCPNKPESGLSVVVENLYPANYKYTGGGDVVIGGKIPDFININGQKKIIELFGDYWHKGEDPQDRIDIFKPYGYDTLVVWEHELKDVEKLKLRIIEFHERNHHENNTPEELRHG